jgi:hypothetical protein
MGRAAREFAARRADPAPCAQVFLDVLRAAQSTKGAVLDRLDERRRMEGTLLGSGLDEVRWGAYELGLDQVPGDVARLVAGLLGGDTH